MATCQEEIELAISQSGPEEAYTTMRSNVVEPLVSTRESKAKFIINSSKQESISCSFSQYGTPVDVTIAWFKLDSNDTTVKSVGSIRTKEATVTFAKDLLPGIYYICFSVLSGRCNGDFKATFTSYAVSARLKASVDAGSSMTVSELKTEKRRRKCTEPMEFEFVSGNLPPGLTLTADGSIKGYLPRLDCSKDCTSPSANWFYYNHDGTTAPIPGRWEFKARVKMVNFPEVEDIEDFAIEIYHNWDKERDLFKRVNEYVEVKGVQVAQEKFNPIPAGLCPPPTEKTLAKPAQKSAFSSEIAAFLSKLPQKTAEKIQAVPRISSTEKYIKVINTLNNENEELWMACVSDGSEMTAALLTEAEKWGWGYPSVDGVTSPKTEIL